MQNGRELSVPIEYLRELIPGCQSAWFPAFVLPFHPVILDIKDGSAPGDVLGVEGTRIRQMRPVLGEMFCAAPVRMMAASPQLVGATATPIPRKGHRTGNGESHLGPILCENDVLSWSLPQIFTPGSLSPTQQARMTPHFPSQRLEIQNLSKTGSDLFVSTQLSIIIHLRFRSSRSRLPSQRHSVSLHLLLPPHSHLLGSEHLSCEVEAAANLSQDVLNSPAVMSVADLASPVTP